MKITKPRTQRKNLFQAPAHRRQKRFSAALSTSLKEKHGANAVPVRTGDTVRILRGDRKGLEGKIMRVERQNYRIFVEGVTREKVDGTTIQIPIHPSKVMIIDLNLDDKWRREILDRKEKPSKEARQEEPRSKKKPRKQAAKRMSKKTRKAKKIRTQASKKAKPKTGAK